jgi:hypothetical protein
MIILLCREKRKTGQMPDALDIVRYFMYNKKK